MKFPELLKSVEKVDDNTIRITLNKTDATFLASLGMDFISIYSAEYADSMLKAGKPETLDSRPVGTGPFVFLWIIKQIKPYNMLRMKIIGKVEHL